MFTVKRTFNDGGITVFRLALLFLLVSAMATAMGSHPPSFARDVTIPPPDQIGPDVRIADPAVPLEPPDDPHVGDSWVWWLWTWQPMPPTSRSMSAP
jgi:hypothetical protein